MKTKKSVNRWVISLVVLGALLLTAFTVQAAAPKASASGSAAVSTFEKIGAAFTQALSQERGQSAEVKSSSSDASGEKEISEMGSSLDDESEIENEQEITGTVTAVSDASWTVGSTKVMIDDSTEIEEGLGMGSQVKVEYTTQTDGSFLATEIEPFEMKDKGDEGENNGDEHSGNPVEFTGELTAVNGSSWTIGGKTVLVSDSTKIHGDPQVGATVRVVGLLGSDGSVQARQVIPTNPRGFNGVGSDSTSHEGEHSGSGSGEDHSDSGDH